MLLICYFICCDKNGLEVNRVKNTKLFVLYALKWKVCNASLRDIEVACINCAYCGRLQMSHHKIVRFGLWRRFIYNICGYGQNIGETDKCCLAQNPSTPRHGACNFYPQTTVFEEVGTAHGMPWKFHWLHTFAKDVLVLTWWTLFVLKPFSRISPGGQFCRS